LIQHGAKINTAYGYFTPLANAALRGHIDVVKYFLKRGANPNLFVPIESGNREDFYKLRCWTYSRGMLDNALMIEAEDGDSSTTEQESPLFCTAKNGHTEIYQILVEAGADLEIELKKNDYGHSHGAGVIEAAAAGSHWETFNYLESVGAVLKTSTPLHIAAMQGDAELCRQLISEGADVCNGDHWNYTPLHFAAQEGHLEVCKLLIEKGADINECSCLRELMCRTPLMHAAMFGHPEVCKLLVDSGSRLDVDAEGMTALMSAAAGDNIECCKVLIEAGAMKNGNDEGFQNGTALDIAERKDYAELCRYLRSVGCKRGRDCSE
jgi:ankyrin repeat protein